MALDRADPLAAMRERFCIPRSAAKIPVIYLAGNSLGLMPQRVHDVVNEELEQWSRLGVEGHFEGPRPWYSYHELLRETGARLVGAKPGEVVCMNSLTVNLHLMLVSFFHPTRERFKILMEDAAFPSDMYAVKTHLRTRGLDPDDALLIARPRDGESLICAEDLEELFAREGERIAVVLLGGVNYFTGQVFDMARITSVAQRYGCVVGFDLAHGAGNVPLSLHDWNVDFAVWCNYKYLNSGPGAVAGCFVHERHGMNSELPRFAGWWGNDPATRFRMHLQPAFIPRPGADGWQISNPPIFSLAPVYVSYEMFDEVGMSSFRRKSVYLTGYLQFLLDERLADRVDVITPREESGRGCQLSMVVREAPGDLLAKLKGRGVMSDFREPNVIRVAPVPLYNTFRDVWSFVQILETCLRS
jgi:kynureninase